MENITPNSDQTPPGDPSAVETTREAFAPNLAPLRVDRERSIVHGVRVCGPESKNGRRYPRHVLESSLTRYDGVPVNLDHHTPGIDIPVASRFGRLVNPRLDGEAVSCDLQYNAAHPFAESFLWACEHNPALYGMSHVARVRWQTSTDGIRTAESIEEVTSVDIVADPATTRGIFESLGAHTKPDPLALAKSFESTEEFGGFLIALFDALEDSTFDDDAKQKAVNGLFKHLGGNQTSEPVEAPILAGAQESRSFAGDDVVRAAVRAAEANPFAAIRAIVREATIGR